jgi:hypothetical protein
MYNLKYHICHICFKSPQLFLSLAYLIKTSQLLSPASSSLSWISDLDGQLTIKHVILESQTQHSAELISHPSLDLLPQYCPCLWIALPIPQLPKPEMGRQGCSCSSVGENLPNMPKILEL